MAHPLEKLFDLSPEEILDAIYERMRLRVAVAGAVAEVQCEKVLRELQSSGSITGYESHDIDGYPDFTIWLPGETSGLLMEVKNVRNSKEAYRKGGEDVAYKVEAQKTRSSTEDKSSRLYDANYFQILGVCLGAKTGDYTDFFFVRTKDLQRDKDLPHKLKSMQRVPLPASVVTRPSLNYDVSPWYENLKELLELIQGESDG